MPGPFPWEWVLYAAGAVTVITGAVTAIIKLANPYRKIVARLSKCEELLEKDNRRISREEASTTVILESQFAILKHLRTNNSTGLMDAAIDDLQRFLIDRKSKGKGDLS